jgi:hypothetical protein
MIDLATVISILSPVVMLITVFGFIRKYNKAQYEEGVKAGEQKQIQKNLKKSVDAAHEKIRGIEHDCDVRLLEDTEFKTEIKTKLNTLTDSMGIMVGKMDTVQKDVAGLKVGEGMLT